MARVDFHNPRMPDGSEPATQLMTLNMGPSTPRRTACCA